MTFVGFVGGRWIFVRCAWNEVSIVGGVLPVLPRLTRLSDGGHPVSGTQDESSLDFCWRSARGGLTY